MKKKNYQEIDSGDSSGLYTREEIKVNTTRDSQKKDQNKHTAYKVKPKVKNFKLHFAVK